jgi:PucR C-terminal helix-turn-helix domain/Purine catabolism regulatory protein-like family/GGDEF-like domain
MTLTVADIVRTPHLGLELLAEGDLSQPVRWVHATDQADPTPYLRGGEVVLTDGLWLAGGTAPIDYVRRLADAGTAAIGFGLIEGHPPPPPALTRACRRRRVTLFAVPVDVPFLAISERFVEHMIEEREEPLRRTLRRNERLLDAVSGPDGAAAVLRALHDELGSDVWLRDRSGALLAHAGEPPGQDGLGSGAWLRFRLPGPGDGHAELGVRRTERPLSVDGQTAIQQALTVLSVEAGHREALRQTHRRFAAELFELAREGESQASAIAQRLRGLGLEPDAGLVAIVCDRPDADGSLGRFEDALRAADLRAVATVRAGRLLAVGEWDPKAPADALGAQLVEAMGPESAVGVGAPVAHCALLDVSLGEAGRACRLARMRQDGRRSASARQLTSHAGLLAQQDPDLLEHFCRELLDPLAEYDAARGAELLPTLTAFLASGGRWAATADALHVHVNTLRHRLERVEALTGRELGCPDDRVDLHLALRARGLIGSRP